MACNGLKMGLFHSFVHPKWSKIIFGRAHFQRIFHPFWSQREPFLVHFMAFEGPKWLAMGSKWAHFTCLGTPNGLGSFLEKHVFDPFLTCFLSQESPSSTHCGILRGPKQATTSSKRAKNTCFGIPCGPRSFLKNFFFFCTRWTLLTHFGTHLFGLPPTACRRPSGLGAGV